MFSSSKPSSGASPTDPFATTDDDDDAEGDDGPQNAYSWAWNFFADKAGQYANREQAESAQFSDAFEEMMRDEGMAEGGDSTPTRKFWGLIGGLSGGALGFIVANVPGLLAGAVAGNRLGAIRDAKGKSVYAVFQVSLLFFLHAARVPLADGHAGVAAE